MLPLELQNRLPCPLVIAKTASDEAIPSLSYSSPLTCSPCDFSRRAGEDLGEGETLSA